MVLAPSILAVAALSPASALPADTLAANSYVHVVVAPPARATPGDTSDIVFRLMPEPGIHVNAEPAVSFTADTAAGVTVSGSLEQTKDDATGFLAVQAPLRQRIAFSRTAAGTPVFLKGTLTFFFCSDEEEWCMRAKQPVMVRFDGAP